MKPVSSGLSQLKSQFRSQCGAAAIEYATLVAILCLAIIPSVSNLTQQSEITLAKAFAQTPVSAALRAGPNLDGFDNINSASRSGDGTSGDDSNSLILASNDDGGGTWNGTPGSGGSGGSPSNYAIFTAMRDDDSSGSSGREDSTASPDSSVTAAAPNPPTVPRPPASSPPTSLPPTPGDVKD